jgi:radical SAM protein with 4Fe4S-binding SPASM domain
MCEYGYRLNNTSLLNDNTVFTGMCDLGVTRVFVDVDGNLHSCEQIIDSFPIGNVVEGYNLETIKKLLENWNNEIKKNECWNCDIWMLCDFCFANSCNREEISLNKCNIAKNNIKNILLPRYIELLEKEDEGFKTCECDTISNFLELL